MACLLFWVDTVGINGWLYVVRHAIHDTPEAGRLPPDRSHSVYADVYFALKEGLEALFGRSVDLVTPSSLANPYFRDRIAAERRTLYAR